MKHLPKHLQPRWRYLAVAVEAWPDAEITRRDFQAALWESGRALLGDPGSADADLTVLRFDFAEGAGEAMVRARRDEVTRARAALACVESVAGHPVGLAVLGVSGTVRAGEEKYLSERPQARGERTVAFGGAERPAVVRGSRLDVRERGDDGFTGATDLDLEQG
jgi:ribonuclease P/MRP protein subunit POP5